MRYALFAAVRFNRDAARHVATKTIHAAFMVVSVEGGGIFAKTARPRPYSRAYAGMGLRGIPIGQHLRHAGINGNGEWGDDDAARRVATSFGNRENRI